jgi:LysR family transcriptional regulator, nitrogen assimilation regulatory protein
MDLRQLRSLVYIADCGSLSRAAEILRTSQPSLSQQIKHLEAELGVELLHRHARGVTLTELGHAFCAHARTIMKDVERAKEEITAQADSPSGKVSVGLPTSACRGIASYLIRIVSDKYPNISLHILEGMTGTLDEWVQLGRLDVALLYDHKAFANIDPTEIMLEDLMLMAGKGNPILQRAQISFSELQALPIVLPSNQHVIRNLIERLAARENFVPNVVIDCDSLPGIIDLVRNGYMTVMPHFAMLEEINRNEVGAVAITNPTPFWRLSTIVSQRTINSRSAQVVAKTLVETIQALVANGTWQARLNTNR